MVVVGRGPRCHLLTGCCSNNKLVHFYLTLKDFAISEHVGRKIVFCSPRYNSVSWLVIGCHRDKGALVLLHKLARGVARETQASALGPPARLK